MSSSENVLWRVSEWYPNLSPLILEKLKKYHSELIRYNARVNLISRQTERDADEQHFADCISACELMLSKGQNLGLVYDLGSGNGLPGVVLAILAEGQRPDIKVRLIDSDERKVEFLKHVASHLELGNVDVMRGRIEDIKERASAALTRGFASVSKVVLICKETVDVGASIYHMKGSNWVREVGEMPSQLCAHWSPQLVGEYSLPLSRARRAVIATKRLK